jgi:hypothetical protein
MMNEPNGAAAGLDENGEGVSEIVHPPDGNFAEPNIVHPPDGTLGIVHPPENGADSVE